MDTKDLVIDRTTKYLSKKLKNLGYQIIFMPQNDKYLKDYATWRIILTTDVGRYRDRASIFEYGMIVPPRNLKKIGQYIKKFKLEYVGKAFIIKHGRIEFLLD